jgi:hypothetical protein
MSQDRYRDIIKTLERKFDEIKYKDFIGNLLNGFDHKMSVLSGTNIYADYRSLISSCEQFGLSKDGKIGLLIVSLKKGNSLERARTFQRDFVAKYLQNKNLDAALAAFVSSDSDEWRFSLVKMEYAFEENKGNLKAVEQFTPARRYSFLVGAGQSIHTAQAQLLPILSQSDKEITLEDLEVAFNIETVTDEFYDQYKELYDRIWKAMNDQLKNDPVIKEEFEKTKLSTENFVKRLLGQIVFLYFLQRKGWLGVEIGEKWGQGDKDFLRSIFKELKDNENYFNDKLEYLFYEALREDRRNNKDLFEELNCRIPFLNGGLFDPINNYDWQKTNITIPNDLFSNTNKVNGDMGDGILDIFDRYNFTVNEDDPLEREVAIDPEMLGKVFERMLPINERRKNGAFYTPREIVQHICQASLKEYLISNLKENTDTKDLDLFFLLADRALANEKYINDIGHETETYKRLLPDSIQQNAGKIDNLLSEITVIDPAVGSGAFPVGMMSEIVRLRKMTALIMGKKFNEYDLKLHCIRSNIYGVDIEPSAVEICKLRLWLSLIVDEDNSDEIKPLPNLDYKVREGDSLKNINDNFAQLQAHGEIMASKEKLFNETDKDEKEDLKDKIDSLIGVQNPIENGFNFQVYFSEVFNNGGFDIVIGNPPYGGEKIEDDTKKQLAIGSKDAYGAFISRSLYDKHSLLKQDGILGFIVSDTFMTIKTHLALRKQMMENRIFQMLRVHPDTFDATVNACVMLVQKKDGDVPEDHRCSMVDLTRVSARENHDRFIEIISRIKIDSERPGNEKVLQMRGDNWRSESSEEYAIYVYPQSLINKNTNNPFFVASPKLFAFMHESGVSLTRTEIGGKQVLARSIEMNDKQVQVVKLGDIADVKVGLQTGDNNSYLFQNPESRGSYRSIEDYKDYLLTEDDLQKIRDNEELRIDVIDNGISKDDKTSNRYFGGRYIVPYDKGGESNASEGWLPNYYVPTNYFIDWSEWAVKRMKTLTIADRKREQGKEKDITPKNENQIAAVFRNTNTYFKEGVTLSYTGQYAPNLRFNSGSLFDVGGSSIYAQNMDELIGIFNTKFVKYFAKNSIDHTVNFQVDEVKNIPYVLLDNYKKAKISETTNTISSKQRLEQFYDYASQEQLEIDQLIYEAYGLNKQDIKEVENWYARRYPKLVAAQRENLRKKQAATKEGMPITPEVGEMERKKRDTEVKASKKEQEKDSISIRNKRSNDNS